MSGTLLAICACLAACGIIEVDDPNDTDDTDDTDNTDKPDDQEATPLSYDEFVENFIYVFADLEGNERITYDDDVVFRSWEEVQTYYDAYLEVVTQGSTSSELVLQALAGEVQWSAAKRKSITYCVSDDFYYAKFLVADAVAEAARAWEAVADVEFIELSAQNENCTAQNTAVEFNVSLEQWGTLAPHATAFPPNAPRTGRELAINWDVIEVRGEGEDVSLWSGPDKNTPFAGVFRHQLGHILGLGHQVGSTDGGHCLVRNLTPNIALAPDENSGMLAAPCTTWSTSKNKAMNLSIGDKARIANLYPAP